MRGRGPSMMLAGGVSLRPETKALVARMSVTPSKGRQVTINRLVGKLIDLGLWQHADFDALYVFAAHDAQAARLNWFAANAATAVSSPTFTADRGYAGDGAAAYLTGAACNAAVGDGHLGGFVQSGGASVGNGNGYARLAIADNSISGAFAALNVGGGSPTGVRHAVGNWSPDTTAKAYKNGSLYSTTGPGYWGDTFSSGSPATILKTSSGGGDAFAAGRIAAAHYGKALSDQQISDLYAALNAYMIEVGAAS